MSQKGRHDEMTRPHDEMTRRLNEMTRRDDKMTRRHFKIKGTLSKDDDDGYENVA